MATLPDALLQDLQVIEKKKGLSGKEASARSKILESTDIEALKQELKKVWATVDQLEAEAKNRSTRKAVPARTQGSLPPTDPEDASNPDQMEDFRRISREAENEKKAASVEGLFSLFARIDKDRSGKIDAEELHDALSTDANLQKRFATVVGMSADEALEKIERAAVAQIDENWDGGISSVEFERT